MRFNQLRQGNISRRLLFWAAFGLTLAIALIPLVRSRFSDGTAAATGGTAVQSAPLGINLSGVSDWSTQMPFLDAFKSSRKWIPQCISGDPDCAGTWSTEEYDLVDVDERGWVKSLPAPEDAVQYTRVATLLRRDVKRYPGGKYVVLYDGEGTIEYKFDARKNEAESAPGRDVLEVTPSEKGILLIITATDPQNTGNYIRNIRAVPAEYEATFESEVFNPQFLDRIRRFKAIRFMNWMDVNDSQQGEWSKRPVQATASFDRGVPVEVMVKLVNQLGADPWFNMPHMGTDEYITEFAQLVKRTLNADRTIYLEYSNEVWNPQFEQFRWVDEQSRREWGEEAPYQWYGKRTAQMCDIWKQVFAADSDRVVCVMGTQSRVRWRGEQALTCPLWSEAPCYEHGIDAFAITGYFGGYLGKPEHETEILSWLDEPDGGFNQLFTELRDNSVLRGGGLQETFGLIRENLALARRYGLALVAYEGGQHIVARHDVENTEALTDFFIAANQRPEMYDIYTQLLNEWKRLGGGIFMHFTDIGRPSRSGSWGALDHVDQTSSPKYDALMDYLDRNP